MQDTKANRQQIEQLWKKLPNNGCKTQFINHCAKKYSRESRTIRQWWFSKSGCWSVPEAFQDQVITDLEAEVNKQNELINSN